MIKLTGKAPFIFAITAPFLSILLSGVLSCNNPFSTREAQEPDPYSGAAIKPANSPENVIFNMRVAFESMSIQDYLDIFSEDFVFNPDPDDSLLYVEDFRNGWDYEKESIFAENFLQTNTISEIEVYPSYEYKPGLDAYEYTYSMIVFPADSTQSQSFEVKGLAWIYLKENQDGTWKIYRWVELENQKIGAYITWGVLRASYI